MDTGGYRDVGWDRVSRAAEAVRDRLRRTVAALDAAGVRYVVVGGNAVAAWVAQVDESAVRNTRNVDISLDRADVGIAAAAMAAAGFVHRPTGGSDLFFDAFHAKDRDRVRIIYAGEFVRSTDVLPAPDVRDVVRLNQHPVPSLITLVRMKLTAYRTIDRVHVRDMIDVGLVDASWPARFQPELAARLQELLDDPDG